MSKLDLSKANGLTIGRCEFLTFAASSFIACHVPWLDLEGEQPTVLNKAILEEVSAIDWEDIMNTVIGNTNGALAGRSKFEIYDEGSPERIMERVLNHNLHGNPLPNKTD
jgi:hypothetical protein